MILFTNVAFCFCFRIPCILKCLLLPPLFFFEPFLALGSFDCPRLLVLGPRLCLLCPTFAVFPQSLR